MAVTPQAAQAAGQVVWSAANVLGVPYGSGLLTGKDGSLVAGNCTTFGDIGAKIFSSGGSVLGTIPMVTITSGSNTYKVSADAACELPWSDVGKDGTVYGMQATASRATKVAAYKQNGTKRWVKFITPQACPSTNLMPTIIRVGADGNVYIAGNDEFNSCNGGGWYVTSFTPGGTLRWQVKVGGAIQTLAPYNGGVIAASTSQRSLYYLGYDGSAVATVPIDEIGDLGIDMRGVGVNIDGSVTFSANSRSSSCGQNGYYATSVVARYNASGLVYRYFPAECTYVASITANRSGSVTFVKQPMGLAASIVTINTAGAAPKEIVLSESGNDRQIDGIYGIIADTNGNLLIWRNYTFQSSNSSMRLRGAQFRLVNPDTGSQLAIFNTDSIDSTIGLNGGGVALARGVLYLNATVCYNDNCSSTGPKMLYALSFAELGMDYPRGAVLGLAKKSATATMVVAGDSFSSGVGSLNSGESYDAGTNTSTDRCLRSPNAYAHLLDADPSLSLQMSSTAFVACSGATTVNITTAKFNTEKAQVTRIPTAAKVVVLSIGGNDVKFSRLSGLCIFLDCSTQAVQDEFNGYLNGLSSTLAATYKAIIARAPNAHVYVVGYPYIMPESQCSDTGNPVAWGALQALRINGDAYAASAKAVGLTDAEATEASQHSPELTDAELQATRSFEDRLNLTIGSGVTEANQVYPGRVHYVDTSAMQGQLCSASPSFNGLDIAETANTFHPNAAGQRGLYLLVRAAIAANQPQYAPLG